LFGTTHIGDVRRRRVKQGSEFKNWHWDTTLLVRKSRLKVVMFSLGKINVLNPQGTWNFGTWSSVVVKALRY
jgi:hypothetical protein